MKEKIIIILLIITSFLVRPTAFGSVYNEFGIILAIFSLMIYLYINKRNNLPLLINNRIIFYSVFILFLYSTIQSVFMNASNIDFMIKAMISNIIIVVVFSIILSNYKLNDKYFKSIINIFIILIISYLSTVFISIFIPLDLLKIGHIPLDGYSDTQHNIYFPLTHIYGIMNSRGHKLLRIGGFFRESGIFQLFLVWAFFSVERYYKKVNTIKFILFIGILSTFSTGGVFIFIIGLGIEQVLKANKKEMFKKSILMIFISIVAIYILFYFPNIGLRDKMISHGTSIETRFNMTIRGAKLFFEYPFGIGMYNTMKFEDGRSNTGINLIASSYKLGIIGIVFLLLIYILPIIYIKDEKYKNNYLICILPILITIVFLQPIIDGPIIYILLLANYGKNNFFI